MQDKQKTGQSGAARVQGAAPAGRPVRRGAQNAAPHAAPSGAVRRAPRVPGGDAFDNLPRRRPPNLPGYEQDLAGIAQQQAPARGEAQADRRESRGRQAPAQAQPREKARPPRPVSPAKRRRNRKIFAVATIAVLLCAGLVFSFKVLFKIETYKVTGDSAYTQDEIVAAFGRDVGDNMFGFNVRNAVRRIEKTLPYIENSSIKRVLPGTVVFKVEHAQETYSVCVDGQYAVLSASYKVLRLADGPQGGLTEIRGLTGVQLVPGTKLEKLPPGTSPPQAPAPLPESVVPIEGEPAPTEGEPAPTEGEPAPAEGEPAPTEGEPAPTEGEPAPTEGEPAPTEGEPAPTEGEPAPTEGEPAPTEGEPAPTEGGPAPTEGEPAPTEPDSAATDAGADAVVDGESFDNLMLLLEKFKEYGFTNPTWVDVSDPLGLSFRWEDRITVSLGGAGSIDEKLRFVQVLMLNADTAQISQTDRGTLDVSAYPNQSDAVYLRPEFGV